MAEHFELHGERRQAALETAPFHTWFSPNGTAWTEFYRLSDHYLLRFPGLADFVVSEPGQDVSCHPEEGISTHTIEHLYLNQVLPLVQSKRGDLVFHASAVVIDDFAIAFAAESGRGKSTLAAAFALAGHPFLTDDGLVVEPEGDEFMARPSHPSIRLWRDSEEALVPPGTPLADPVSYTSKSRFLGGESLPFCNSRTPLGCAYFLGGASPGQVEITPIKASDTMIEWVRHSFLLDIEERPRISSHFDQVAALARKPMHFRLEYPREYARLQELMERVIDHARECRKPPI